MHTTKRPDRILAVEALLNQMATDSSRIPDADYQGRTSWKLGCCEAMLAQANGDLNRLERQIAELRAGLEGVTR